MNTKESTRLSYVLETALAVFFKHGFRKTSIEDIAQAAGISRQGIYLHYKNKDEIFRAAIQKTLDDGLEAVEAVLLNADLKLEEKLFGALDEWFGRHAGLFQPDASDLAAQSERVLGEAVEHSNIRFQRKIEAVILSSSEQTERMKNQAATIVDILYACALTWKHSLGSRQEFSDKLRAAIRLCCRDL
ncbi:TetR/AcrR family transcriptional regulator [Paenibacillus macerans]|uniref:TetR/AcrR family transcriptional regulator n=1 Tax=Paenibacillus macerans TaxID=44252 RepID=UPI003D315FF7